MEKRGMGVMFKWIFALVAGMVIFLFLINFGYKHISLSESKISAVLLTSLESQLESLSFSEFLSEESLDLGEEFTINFACNSLSTKDGNINTEKIIFSDNQITSKTLSLFTQTWYYPFDITNFFYITDLTYYFFNPPADLILNIPSNFKILTYPDNVPQDAIIIFFREPTNEELREYQNHPIKIIRDNKVTFYPVQITDFYGDEMMLGAIFTEDFKKFECLKQKALLKLKLVSAVYQKKAQELGKFECTDRYQNIINELGKFKTNITNENLIENLDKDLEKNGCTPLFH